MDENRDYPNNPSRPNNVEIERWFLIDELKSSLLFLRSSLLGWYSSQLEWYLSQLRTANSSMASSVESIEVSRFESNGHLSSLNGYKRSFWLRKYVKSLPISLKNVKNKKKLKATQKSWKQREKAKKYWIKSNHFPTTWKDFKSLTFHQGNKFRYSNRFLGFSF